MKKIATITLGILLSVKILGQSTWSIDKSHSKLGFTITHLMISDVEGSFKILDAKITATNENFSDALIEMTADVNSINTDNEQRDAHLIKPDFFDAEKYPVITFKSKSFKKVSDTNYKVTGELTMHGITKTVELDAACKVITHPMNKKTIAGFKISGIIKRSEFGIAPTTSTSMLSDEVSIIANAEFIKN